MSDMDFNQAKPPEEENFEEAASQAYDAANTGLEDAAEPVVEAVEETVEPVLETTEQIREESAVLVGEIIDTSEETAAEAGEVVEEAPGEIAFDWQAEPVEFSTVSSEPVVEISEREIPPPSPAWQPEPAETPEVPETHKATPPPAAPVRPSIDELSPDDERTWALLAHLSVLLNLVTGFLGPVAAIVIYFAFKDRSRYVRYHAMQAFLFQLLWWVGGGILTTILWVSVGLLAVVIVGLCLIPFALVASLIPLAALVYGVIGGVQVSQGQDFRYWLVGDWVRGELNGD